MIQRNDLQNILNYKFYNVRGKAITYKGIVFPYFGFNNWEKIIMIREMIDYLEMVQFDNSLIMAIIAINMTVIGLTSLADKKTVIGVDYGEFLIKKFKYLNIRMYYWLIVFALINIISLFTMLISEPKIRLINFIILIFSVIFAIVYFFGFILIENKWVIRQIYISEILGMYCDDNNKEHFYIDTMVKMNSGNRTTKRISTNVVNYFNNYNADSQKAFIEAFGKNSIIYSNEKLITREVKKKYNNISKYNYRISRNNKYIKDISFEFFQLFRFVENQGSWALEILQDLNGFYNDYKNYDILRLYNFLRLTAQINIFGVSEDIFKYKFLFHYRYYWYNTVNKNKTNKPENEEEIKVLEKEIVSALFSFIAKGINIYKNNEYINIVNMIFEEIIIDDKYKGFLSIQEILNEICKISIKTNCKELQQIIEKNIGKYKYKNGGKNQLIDIEKLKDEVRKIYISISKENDYKENIFINRDNIKINE